MPYQAKENLAALIESTEDYIWSVDLNFGLITFNSAFQRHVERSFGTRAGVGMRPEDMLPPDRAAQWPRLFERALAEGPFRIEIPFANGRIIDVSFNRIVVDGEPTGISAFGKDITAQKRAEMELRETAEFLEETQRIGALGSYVMDIPTGLWNGSDFLGEILGIDTRSENTAEAWIGLVHPEDREEIANYLFTEVIGKRGRFDREYRIVRASDNAVRWLHGMGRLDFDAQGRPLKMRGVIRDITDRKHAELALRDSQEFALSTIDALSSALCVLDETGAIIAVNRTWREFAEANRKTYNDGEAPGFDARGRFNEHANYLDVCDAATGLDAAEAARFAAGIRAVLRGESKGFSQEYSCHSPDKKRWFVGKVTPLLADGHLGAVIEHIDITAIKEGEAQLQEASQRLGESEQRYRAAFEQAAVGIAHCTFDGRFLRCNARFAEIAGYPIEELLQMSFQQITPPEDLVESEKVRNQLAAGTGTAATLEKRYLRKDGSLTWIKLTASVQRDTAGRALYSMAMVEDINARKEAEQRLAAAAQAIRASEERYRTAFQTSLDAVTISRLADGVYIDCNKAFLDTTGYERHEVLGHTSLELKIWVDPRDRKSFVDILRQSSTCRDLEVRLGKKNGESYWGLVSASLIELDGEHCVLLVTRDISDAKAAAEQIRNLAFYDPLTGLPNRRLLLDRLQQVLIAGARQGSLHALMLIDLDHFKTLNDTLGHQTGDLLLQEVARRLAKHVHEAGTLARLVGDEFVVVFEGLSEDAEDAGKQAKASAEKMLAAMAEPYLIAGRECRGTASIGITIFGDEIEGADEVLQQAGIAMDQAKAEGSNTARFFSPALQTAVNARAAMDADLRQAIDANQFVLYYQPQVEGDHLIGAEALIRWNHPARGLLPPGEFIAFAEETGLILPLGDWVLETACRQIAAWAHQDDSACVSVAVNISARQFHQPDFVQKVLGALERSGADPHHLELELTESMLADSIEEVIAKMTELKSHGLRFSLDDFGTGYSSLAYLKRLPLDKFKIDRSFVQDILVDASSGAIAQTIISLSRAMGLPVIAEGIETEAQRDFLIGLGCHSFQGYLFGRPLALKEFERQWLGRKECDPSIPIEPASDPAKFQKGRSIA
jgi:diguanylate cyclase (GGDEF)-like protein/PAS domain S-box-containing protein